MTHETHAPTFLNARAQVEHDPNKIPQRIILELDHGNGENYTVIKTLGTGGEATAYLAVCENTGQKRTIKLFNPGRKPRKQEHKINSYFSDSVRYASFDDDHSTRYLEVLPYKPGISLKEYLRNNEPNLERDSIIAAQFCQILNKIHHKSPTRDFVLTHCDLKQENLIIYDSATDAELSDEEALTHSQLSLASQQEGGLQRQNSKLRLDLIDFGCAETLTDTDERVETKEIKGTGYFMPPEQCQNHTRSVGVKSDLYSATAILLRLLGVKNPTKTKEEAAKDCNNLSFFKKQLPKLSIIPFDSLNDSHNFVANQDKILNKIQHLGILFLNRLQHPDYEMRPDSDELLFFFNTLHLLVMQRYELDRAEQTEFLITRLCLSTLATFGNQETYYDFKDEKFSPFNELNINCETPKIRLFCQAINDYTDQIIHHQDFNYYASAIQILLKQSHELSIDEFQQKLNMILHQPVNKNHLANLPSLALVLSHANQPQQQYICFNNLSETDRHALLRLLKNEASQPYILLNKEKTQGLYNQLMRHEIRKVFITYYRLHCSWFSRHFGNTLYKKLKINPQLSLDEIEAHIQEKSGNFRSCQSRLFLQKIQEKFPDYTTLTVNYQKTS